MVNGVVFSELGFQYYGPVDGHDLKEVIAMLEQVKELKGPVLLHVVTEKGRGYPPAAEDATAFHGTPPFDLETGKVSTDSAAQAPTYTEAFSQALTGLAAEEPRIVAVTAAMADGTGLEEFRRRYPSRFFDVGIAEQTAVSFAAALALDGHKPVVAVYSSFLQRAYDQLIQDAALQSAPVVFALDRSGLVGEDGPTHHGAFDLSYLNHIPDMAVLLPRDEYMLSHMLRLACGHEGGPVALRYPKGRGLGADAIEMLLPRLGGAPSWGKGQMLRTGSQVMIIAAGPLVYDALVAAQTLEEEGLEVAVYDPCFLKPLDRDGIWEAARWCNMTLTAEENAGTGGLGMAVTQLLTESGYHGKIRNLHLPDEFIPHGSQKELRKRLGLDAEGMMGAIRDMCR
jgi:1-deoxy-D-xylulose-5-phosphate synthase